MSVAVTARRLALAACGLLPFLLGAGDDTLEINRQKIETMTAAERTALQQKFAAWKNLPEAEKEKHRALHKAIDADSSLVPVLNAYSTWLTTLSAAQREELRNTSDATARMALVRKFKEEQDRKPGPWAPPSGGLPLGRPEHGMRISPQDIEPALTVLENRLPPAQKRGFEELPERTRHVRIVLESLKLAEKRSSGERPAGERPVERPANRWPDDALLKELVEAVPEPYRNNLSNRRPEVQRDMIRHFLSAGIAAEWQDEFRRQQPKDEELQKFAASMEKEPEHLMAGDRDEFRRKLIWLYFARNQSSLSAELQEVAEVMQRLRPGLGMRRPGVGERPPSEGPPGERPPGERRGEGPPPRRPGEGRAGDGRHGEGPPGGERGAGRPDRNF